MQTAGGGSMNRAVLLPLLLMLASTSLGQTSQPVTVWLANSAPNAPEVYNALLARLQASGRYKLTAAPSANVFAELVCVKLATNGFACILETSYRDLSSYLSDDSPNLLVSGDSVYVAEELFEHFVKTTSDEGLQESKRKLTRGVSAYCDDASHRVECHRNY